MSAETTQARLEDHETRALFERYRATGDRDARDQIVAAHHWLAAQCARRFANRGEPLDELTQVAFVGVFKAAERFDPEFGVPFTAFATPTAIGEIRRHFRDKTWSVRVPRRAKDLHVRLPAAIEELTTQLHRSPTPGEVATYIGVAEDAVLEAIDAGAAYRASSLDAPRGVTGASGAETHGGADPLLARTEDRSQLESLLSSLPEREREIVYLRFFEDLSQSEIAERMGVSQVHVSRLLRTSIDTLRSLAADERQ